MAENTRILFTDLDGTLLNDKKEITPGNQEAINQALEAGHKVVISTGRPLASGLIIAERAGLVKEGCYIIALRSLPQKDDFWKNAAQGAGKEYFSGLYRQGITYPVLFGYRSACPEGLHGDPKVRPGNGDAVPGC